MLSRATAGVKQGDASMAVLLQELLQPSVAFVLHTASPLGDAPDTAVVEIAPGLGETLASGTRGSAWRLAVAKGAAGSGKSGSKASSNGSSVSNGKSSNGRSSNGKSSNGKSSNGKSSGSGSGGEVTTLAFANFSQAQLPQRAVAAERVRTLSYSPSASSINSTSSLSSVSSVSSLSSVSSMDGGAAVAAAPDHKATGAVAAFASATRTVDYSKQQLSVSAEAREALGRRIGAIAALLEEQFGGAQDVEGCVVGEDVYIVQTRPQPQ